MTAGRGRWLVGGTILVAALGVGALAFPAFGQSSDMQVRLQRLERDVRDLQAATFKRPPGPVADSPASVEPQPAIPDINPMMRRLDGLESSVTQLTGRMEELGHQVDLLSQKLDRLQKQADLQANAQAAAGAGLTGGIASAAADAAAPPPPPNALASASPPPDAAVPTLRPYAGSGTLGQLPAGTALPTPVNDAAALQTEYDSAQALLNRAQYDGAAKAFRTFADAHPDSELTPHALYRTGDIAYSIQKDYDSAARNFAELLKKYPMSADAPDSMMKLGLSLVALGQMKEGCAALAALPAKYPDASPVIAARARNARRDSKCR